VQYSNATTSGGGYLLLALVVGGSALVACITIFTGHNLGLFAAMLAGLIMVGFTT